MKSLAEQHWAKPPYKSLQIICLCKYIIYNDLQSGLSPCVTAAAALRPLAAFWANRAPWR